MKLRITVDTDDLHESGMDKLLLPEGASVEVTLPVHVRVDVQQEMYAGEALGFAQEALRKLCHSASGRLDQLAGVQDDDAGRVTHILEGGDR